ncbi:hypothetical protein G6O69_01225 [Pseudenhygromyxa sp. WMMC2535]|uniref:DUF3592 domain-containing protein n=1 Tax=Pseudenhygromyxa sp. WMMC2535 TaxID=2712867 RepID=UPI0015953B02|nr:DUF3592 domain-containing protein [Pseudenhygromyxa sp. WMMC2535]NVB36433.1 hypothetical protein [Pseudenhygromyxa sp. WMMC2535]
MTAPGPTPRQDLPPTPPGLKRLGLGILFAFVFGVFALLAGPFILDGWREYQILENGEDAVATLLVMRDTKDRANDNPIVAMTVEVHPEEGKPYRAQIVTPISMVALQNYRVGGQVRIRFDPKDPTQVALVGPIIERPEPAPAPANTPAAAPAPANTAAPAEPAPAPAPAPTPAEKSETP